MANNLHANGSDKSYHLLRIHQKGNDRVRKDAHRTSFTEGVGGWWWSKVVDCPIQLTLVTWICQLCSTTNTSEKYERTQQGNLLGQKLFGQCHLERTTL